MVIQDQTFTHCSNTTTELIVDYNIDFTTYEIFQTREVLIKWAREVDKSYDFMIIITKSDALRNGKKGKISLSCERSGIYKGKEVKFNRENTSEQQR